MPKNRKRVLQKGAKSESVRTKFKVGGRKSGRGVNQMSRVAIIAALRTARSRDHNKLFNGLAP